MSKVCIFGAGGFGREVAWLIESIGGEFNEIEFLVDEPDLPRTKVMGYNVCFLESAAGASGRPYVIAIGDPAARMRVAQKCEENGLRPTTLIHPRVEMSRTVRVGAGTIICAGSILTVDIEIGRHTHVNLDCTIGHDVRIGNFVTLSPGVHVSGNVRIGDNVFIGTGATIINGSPGRMLEICDGSVVAAGACVTRSVDAGSLVAGVPAVRKR